MKLISNTIMNTISQTVIPSTLVANTLSVSPTVFDQYIPGELQTKDWRKAQNWYIDGKRNECELFQRKQLETMLGVECVKTNLRFNTETYGLHTMTRPLDLENGFEWTEDFDGLSIIGDKKLYFNLKFICDAGGAQTRSLREVYHFTKCQLEYLYNEETSDPKNVYFINILDGNTAMKHLSKFQFLINKEKYHSSRDNIFIGDMYTFNTWYTSLVK
jgi:hypothetical protein